MTEPDRILAVPHGPDALPEALTRFAVELPSGQAALEVPIRTPPGRNGLSPELRLTYGSVSGPGPFGVGWSLPLMAVRKKGERFLVEWPDGSGGELVALGGGRFRPRADERFARLDFTENKWRIRERDGRIHFLAETSTGRWTLERTQDSFGHRVEYRWQAGRLIEVRWLEHGKGPTAGFLVQVALDYEGARCARLRVQSQAGEVTPIRSYHLDHEEAQNGWLLLRRVRIESHGANGSEWQPPIDLSYTPFDPSCRRFTSVSAAEADKLQPLERPEIDGPEQPPPDFPRIALDDARVHRVDLSGDGLADLVIVRDRSIVYWPKLADGGWGPPVNMGGAPELPDFRPERVFLGDVDGDGLADLVYVGDHDVRLYINRGGRGWSFGAHILGTPSLKGDVSLVALAGGSAGVLWPGARPWLLDLTGGARPYLLSSVSDPFDGVTRLSWAPFSLGLPRPVQVVARVQKNSHTASYVYDGPVWRAGFRGFARVERREGEVETRTWFGADGKSAGRRTKRELRRPGVAPHIEEWSWGAPSADTVYGVVLIGDRSGDRRRHFWDHDAFGQPRAELEADGHAATLTLTQWAGREEPSFYLVDRPARVTRYAVDSALDLDALKRQVAAGERRGQVLADSWHHYDGQPFVGLPLGQVGKHGARVRTERLAFTSEWLHSVMPAPPSWLKAPRVDWTDEYPRGFRTGLAPLGGYVRRPVTDEGHEVEAWYVVSERRRYDFQESGASARGRVTLRRDALEHDTSISYDSYELLPAKVADPRGLHTQAAWDYRLFRPSSLVAASGGRLAFSYSASGLLLRSALHARPGDEKPLRELRYSYDLHARSVRTARRDVNGETLERVEYRDSRGNLIQVRTPAAEVAFAPLPSLGTPDDAVGASADRVLVGEPGRAPRESIGWDYETAAGEAAPAAARKADGTRDLLGRSWGTAARAVVLDAAGRPVEERDSVGALVLRAFDAAGREVRRWARDRDGEPVSLRVWRIFGDSIDSGLPVQRAADAHLLGRLHRQYDEAGLVIHHAYDVDGNLLERTRQVLSEPALTAGAIDWQPHGNLSLESHARELLDERRYRTLFRWDAQGRLVGVTHLEDSAGRRREIQYRRDRAGRVMQVELDGRLLVEHATWDPAGRKLLVAYTNGILQRWSRDRAGRPIRLRAERYEAAGELRFRPTGRVLQEYWCERDSAGRMLTLIDDSPDAGLAQRPHRLERTYTWDDDGRLASATGRESGRAPDWPWEDTPRSAEAVQMRAFSDSYDWRDGHLVKLRHDAGRGSFSREWIFDDEWRLNRLSGSDGYLSYQLDGLGRLVLESSVRRFLWDHAGRLARYRWGEDPPQIDAMSRYDGDGVLALNLVRRPEAASELIVRDGELVHDRGETYRSWLHVGDGDWRIATLRTGPPQPGEPESSLRFYLEDLEGSVALTVDDQGQELGGEGYGALGESTWGGLAGQVFRFRGAERDPVTGLYSLNGRPYAPWLGRFIDDLSELPGLVVDAATQQNLTETPQYEALCDELFRIPIPEDRGTDHGERELPHPGPRHRSEPQGRARPSRRGLGQGANLR